MDDKSAVRRATAVAAAVAAVVQAATLAIACAATYASMWAFHRYDHVILTRMQHEAAARGSHVPVIFQPPPRLGDSVRYALGDGLPLVLLAAAVLLLAHAGRRWAAALVALLPLLGSHGQLPDLPALVAFGPGDDPAYQPWINRAGWTLAMLVPLAVLLVLARGRLPRPAVGVGALTARLGPLVPVVAAGAWLTTAPDDHAAAALGATVALVVGGLLMGGGGRRPWLAVATVWLLLAAMALPWKLRWGASDESWFPGALLPAGVLLALGAAAVSGRLARVWAWAFRRGPALRPRAGDAAA